MKRHGGLDLVWPPRPRSNAASLFMGPGVKVVKYEEISNNQEKKKKKNVDEQGRRLQKKQPIAEGRGPQG